MGRYKRDPDTGAIYADGGIYDGGRSHDQARHDREDFQKMLERRAPELARPLTFSEQLDRMFPGRVVKRQLAADAAARRSRLRVERPRVEARSRITSSDRPGMFVAVEDFDYADPYIGRVHVTAGKTYVSSKSSAYMARPSAFAA
jgi:hypothetical protein